MHVLAIQRRGMAAGLASSVSRKGAAMPFAQRSFPMFKEYSGNAKPTYRQCTALSPWGALVEASILARLATFQTLAPSVYSYRLETTARPFIFDYFVRGFERRVQDIGKALRANHDHVVVVADIKNFYASIPARFVTGAAERLLESQARHAQYFVRALIERSVRGLPVGPAVSHVMANEILRAVDEALAADYPGKYFRYVDDLAVVCPSGSTGDVLATLRARLGALSLELHPEKTATLTSSEWFAAEPTLRDVVRWREQDVTFADLLHLGATYFENRNSPHELASAFGAQGLPLFEYMAARRRSSRPRRGIRLRVAELFARFGRRSHAGEIADVAIELRRAYLERLASLTSADGARPLVARWRMQHALRLVGRLALLMLPSEFPALVEALPDRNDTRPARMVLGALTTQRPGLLLPLPGAPMRQFCSLWSAHGRGKVDTKFSIRTPEYLEGAVELVARGVVTPGSIEAVGEIGMLRLANALIRTSARRTIPDFSYEDELESLFLCVPLEQRFRQEREYTEDEPIS